MNLYTSKAVDQLINHYIEKGGEVTELEEGVLGHGHLLLHGAGLKTTVVKEVYINEWSSGHKVRSYNETPKKYEKLI